ncbi:MAG: FAD-dependent monooxygenase [Elsteraceae bacterium]
MKIFVAGGGPAGLYAAYLIAKRRPDAEITLVEQNPADATFGFGVVFSDRALEFLRGDDPETFDLINPAMETWTDLTLVHRGERVTIDGIGFAAIGRLKLLNLLQERLSSVGVAPRYGAVMAAPPDLADYDLIIASDGANSLIRNQYSEAFGTTIAPLNNKFVWYGVAKEFPTLTQTFIDSAHGPFNAHHYRYAPGLSTFIVECAPQTWARAGFDRMSEDESRDACAALFAETLDGLPLTANRSLWRNFPRVANARWSHRNVVLVGDALRTAHFSIGSGTRLALEDVIALVGALERENFDVPASLAAYEAARRPIVDKLAAAAAASAAWYEDFGAHMKLAPWDFAFSYIQRSGRVDLERLRKIAPNFVAGYQRHTDAKGAA